MHTSSSRQEYRPWTGVRPAKSARKNPPAQYSSPGTEATQVPRETSYQAAYSAEGHRSIGLHQVEHVIPSASTNVQPAAVPQPIASAPQAGSSPGPPGFQQSAPPERAELGGTTKGEVSTGGTSVRARASVGQAAGGEVHVDEHSRRFREAHWERYRLKWQHPAPESHLHSSPWWPVAAGAPQK